MNALLEKPQVQNSGIGIANRGGYGTQSLSEAARQFNAPTGTSYGSWSQMQSKSLQRAARTAFKRDPLILRHLFIELSLSSEAKHPPLSAYAAAFAVADEEMTPASKDEVRYRELTHKHFEHGLSAVEQQELTEVEERLDAADEADPRLRLVSSKINEGYDHLRDELKQINSILDRLLGE
jgi:hypothetical protein